MTDHSPPASISHYTITRELGRGGMGVVYLARDTRLDRDVAIKSLPAELASDPARLERFEREAKTLAQLHHPNIAAIYGVEVQDGARYLVLEYVEGDTLAERLDRGPLALDDAVELAGQIAAGIEAAHEAGVVHRDLKPGNVILTPDGHAKVLDFGLARADDPQSNSSAGLDSPTMTTPVMHSPTIAGAILGTAPYMSPEQARGRRVDSRTDVWSFGVVLYEMLTGEGPFRGETATDSIGAILHKDVDLDRLPAQTPAMVRHVMRRCLERDKTKRMQAIGDVRVELEEAARLLESGEYEPVGAAAATRRKSWAWPFVAALLFGGLLASLLLRPSAAAPTLAAPTTTAMPRIGAVTQLTDVAGQEMSPALSPDGKTLLYVMFEGGGSVIYAQRVGGSNPINLTPGPGVLNTDPAFSPDGERIAFVSSREGGGVFVMGATGENPRRVSDVGFDPAWSPDGRSLVYTTQMVIGPLSRTARASLWIVEVETRERRRLDTADPDDDSVFSGDAVEPAWSPDGSRIVFWGLRDGQRDLYTISAEGGDRVALTEDAPTDWNPVWSPDGRSILFLSDRSGRDGLWRLPLGADGRAAGDPVELMPGPASIVEFASTPDGSRLVVTEKRVRSVIERVGFDPEQETFVGRPEIVHESSVVMFQTDVSPDGEWIAFTTGSAQEDINVLRTDGTGRRQLTDDVYKDRGAVWTSDARSLIFYSDREGPYKVFRMNRDGTDMTMILDEDDGGHTVPSLSPDGRLLYATGMNAGNRLYALSPDGTYEEVEAPLSELYGCEWSPDSTAILAFAVQADGTRGYVYVNLSDKSETLLRGPNGHLLVTTSPAPPNWLDTHRFLGWDASSGSFYIGDTSTDTVRMIEGAAGPIYQLHVVKSGTEVYLSRNYLDTNLWMVELEE